MPRRREHQEVGAPVGAVAAALYARNEDPLAFLAETLGGWWGGKLGALIPDIIDPSTWPGHRSLGHGIIPSGGGSVMFAVQVLPGWQEALRSKAADHAAEGGTSGNIWMMLLHFVSGALAGATAGHISHLVLDSGSKKGLPSIG
jgi:hypothetical protein